MTELLTPLLTRIRIPSNNDRVYKDECVFCFDSPVRAGLICSSAMIGLIGGPTEDFVYLQLSYLYLYACITDDVDTETTELDHRMLDHSMFVAVLLFCRSASR